MSNSSPRPVWWPFPRPIFTFLVINSAGVPIIEYPPPESASDVSKTVLVSGLLTAINNFAKEIVGDNINNMTFGSYLVTISKGPNETLCVLLCDTEHLKEKTEAVAFHIELKSLLCSKLPNIGKINYMDITKNQLFREIFEPYYKLKMKELAKKVKKYSHS